MFFFKKCFYRNTGPIEALCIFLRRLSYPTRLGTMVTSFGRSPAALSQIYLSVLEHIYSEFSHLLVWDHARLNADWMARCAKAVYDRDGPLTTCVGFIDGTVREICRPKYGVQKAA